MASVWLDRVLLDHSTSRYHIEYGPFRHTNHIAHGIIALERLGADEERVNQFIRWYRSKLEQPQEGDHYDESIDASPPTTNEDATLMIGQNKGFYSMVNYYTKKLEECGSIELLIKTYFPKLCEGLAASLLHGMIHIGYGFAGKSERVLCEGLAYLHTSYVPLNYDTNPNVNDIEHFGKGDTDILDVLKKIKENQGVIKTIFESEKIFEETGLITSDPHVRNVAILAHGDTIIKYVNGINITSRRNPSAEEDEKVAIRLADWLIDQCIVVYTFSENKNDFVLLHGVTCAWSLRQVVPLLEPGDAFIALRAFTCLLLAVYATQDCPTIDVREVMIPLDGESVWNDVAKECLSQNIDEHCYKLIQICSERWRCLEDKTKPMAGIYFAAARAVLDNEFYYLPAELARLSM